MVVLAGTVAADSVQPRMPSEDEVTDPQGRRYTLSIMEWVTEVVVSIWEWFSRHPNDDSDWPQQHPLSSGRPHGQGGAGG